MATTSDIVIVLDREPHTQCTVNLNGATIVSWKVNDEEKLFLSEEAILDKTRDIQGGIQIVFPFFGPIHLGPQDESKREIVKWNIEKQPENLPNGDVQAVFSVISTEVVGTMPDYPFKLTYSVLLQETELHLELEVMNLSKVNTFTFRTIVQTYFNVSNVKNCEIHGLSGCRYREKNYGAEFEEINAAVRIDGNIYKTYRNTPDELTINDASSTITIRKTNFPDTILGNPWAKTLEADSENAEYLKILCLNVGQVNAPAVLEPRSVFQASEIFEAS